MVSEAKPPSPSFSPFLVQCFDYTKAFTMTSHGEGRNVGPFPPRKTDRVLAFRIMITQLEGISEKQTGTRGGKVSSALLRRLRLSFIQPVLRSKKLKKMLEMFVLPTYNNVFRLEEQILYVQKMKQTCKSSYFVVCTSKEN